MILNINKARAFYYTAKLKSVTLAANELMVTPPAVCKQVKEFEDMLGTKLMFRSGNSIQLTELGQKTYDKCVGVFDKIKEIEVFFEDISRAKSEVLRIGCPPTLAKYIIRPLIPLFKEAYPGIKIAIDSGNNSEMIKSIISHQNELALCRAGPDEKRLKMRVFRREDLVLVVSLKSNHIPTDEISISMLPSVPLILPKQGSGTRDGVFEYFKRFKIEPNIVLESENVDLTKDLVSNGHGASFLLRCAVQEEISNKKLREIRILEGLPIVELGISYLKRKPLSPGAQAFLRILNKLNDLPARLDMH
jgi:DNA-binding transcriptional LysR family regulator